MPSILELDRPNTHCNIGGEDPVTTQGACIMCPRSALRFRPDVDVRYEIAQSLRPWISHIRRLHIQGIAEPFWKGRLIRILEIPAVQDRHDLQISTVTIGTVFSKRVRDQWREICPRSLTLVSIDAASPAAYEKIRRTDGFERVVENLKAFCCEKGPQQMCAVANNVKVFNGGD